MKLLESRYQEQQVILPAIELLNLHYYAQSRSYTESMSAKVYVPGLGGVEFKDNCLSPSTKKAIESDCISAMQRKIGL